MPSNKDRVYIALYYHEREGAYHWAFLLSPKSVSDAPHGTTRYHVTNKLQMRDGALKSTWEYEQLALPKLKTAKLLVKVLIGKVEKARKSFENCVKGVPLVQDDAEWRCRTWVMEAVAQLAHDKVLSKTSVTDWQSIEAESRAYVQSKEAQGRFKIWTETVPTYDLMLRREIVA